jgi:hypothetical protein
MAIDYKIEIGLGGRVRDIAVDAVNSVLCLPLCETKDTRAWNIVQPLPGERVNDGTWEGTFASGSVSYRGIALSAYPSGELGAIFSGGDRVRVPNDGGGFLVPGESAARNMSLAGGDGYVFAHFRRTSAAASAPIMPLIQKQGNSGDDGWCLYMDAFGSIGFLLYVSSSLIFDVVSPLAYWDDEEHTAYGHLDVSSGIASVWVDGVMVGSVGSIVTEPIETAADVLVGGYESGAGNFDGVIALAGIVRDGSANVAEEL